MGDADADADADAGDVGVVEEVWSLKTSFPFILQSMPSNVLLY